MSRCDEEEDFDLDEMLEADELFVHENATDDELRERLERAEYYDDEDGAEYFRDMLERREQFAEKYGWGFTPADGGDDEELIDGSVDWTDYDDRTGELSDLDASDFEGSEDELFAAATELMAMADDFDEIGSHDRAAMHRAEAEALMSEAEGLITGDCDD